MKKSSKITGNIGNHVFFDGVQMVKVGRFPTKTCRSPSQTQGSLPSFRWLRALELLKQLRSMADARTPLGYQFEWDEDLFTLW